MNLVRNLVSIGEVATSPVSNTALVLVCVGLLTACENPVMAGVEPFDPPPIYREWYAELEKCSGLRGDYDALRFYTAESIVAGGKPKGGYWRPPDTITLQNNAVASVFAWFIVKHEMMHDLLQDGSHPVGYFSGVCGDLTNYPAQQNLN